VRGSCGASTDARVLPVDQRIVRMFRTRRFRLIPPTPRAGFLSMSRSPGHCPAGVEALPDVPGGRLPSSSWFISASANISRQFFLVASLHAGSCVLFFCGSPFGLRDEWATLQGPEAGPFAAQYLLLKLICKITDLSGSPLPWPLPRASLGCPLFDFFGDWATPEGLAAGHFYAPRPCQAPSQHGRDRRFFLALAALPVGSTHLPAHPCLLAASPHPWEAACRCRWRSTPLDKDVHHAAAESPPGQADRPRAAG